jgi:hypothetical protein
MTPSVPGSHVGNAGGPAGLVGFPSPALTPPVEVTGIAAAATPQRDTAAQVATRPASRAAPHDASAARLTPAADHGLSTPGRAAPDNEPAQDRHAQRGAEHSSSTEPPTRPESRRRQRASSARRGDPHHAGDDVGAARLQAIVATRTPAPTTRGHRAGEPADALPRPRRRGREWRRVPGGGPRRWDPRAWAAPAPAMTASAVAMGGSPGSASGQAARGQPTERDVSDVATDRGSSTHAVMAASARLAGTSPANGAQPATVAVHAPRSAAQKAARPRPRPASPDRDDRAPPRSPTALPPSRGPRRHASGSAGRRSR